MEQNKNSRKYDKFIADNQTSEDSNNEKSSNNEIISSKKRKLDNEKKQKNNIEPFNSSKKPINNINNPFLISDIKHDEKQRKVPDIIQNDNQDDKHPLTLNQSDFDLILDEQISDSKKIDCNFKRISEFSIEEHDRPKISNIYYINGNKLTVNDLKDGRRIFNNKTEFLDFAEFKDNFLDFRQLLYENLLLNEDFSENLKEKWTMASAIFSTFCYDAEFIEPLINKFNIKTVIVKEASGNSKNIEEIDSNLTFVHPKLDYTMKWGKFHSKLMILKFPDFIRIIIPSANLTNGDWYYWGQIIWFQDFYKKNDKHKKDVRSDFEIYLEKVLESTFPKGYKESKWFQKLNLNIKLYDYSDTCVDLIASSSGRFANNNISDFGIGRLKSLTDSYRKQRGSFDNSHNRLIIQCSSIGKSLKEKFLSDMCEGFMCRKKDKSHKIEIIYPTVQYVDSFQYGRELSSCLFLNKETFKSHIQRFKKFEVIPEIQNSKTIFHSKFFISCNDEHLDPDKISDNMVMYFGSHNFSIAAWGSFEKNDSQVSIANYELGIIFNPIKLRYEEKQKIIKSLLINLNSSCYTSSDVAWVLDDF